MRIPAHINLVALACAAALALFGVVSAADANTATLAGNAVASPASAAVATRAPAVTDRACRTVGIPILYQFALAVFGGHGADLRLYQGTLQSRTGDKLRLKVRRSLCAADGVKTVSVPAGASVRRDGSPATLGDLRRGDRVAVILSSHGDYVLAGDAGYISGG